MYHFLWDSTPSHLDGLYTYDISFTLRIRRSNLEKLIKIGLEQGNDVV